MDQQIESKTESFAIKLRPVAGILLHAQKILNWEKPYHAPLLGSAITMIFMLFWLIDASVLSKLCILGIILVSLDFALPIASGIVAKKEWIEKNEEEFISICQSLATLCYHISHTYAVYCQLKQTNTKTYYGVLLSSLLILAWIGSMVHNLFLIYLVVLGLALYPGLSKQESFKQHMAALSARVASLISPKNKKQVADTKPKSK